MYVEPSLTQPCTAVMYAHSRLVDINVQFYGIIASSWLLHRLVIMYEMLLTSSVLTVVKRLDTKKGTPTSNNSHIVVLLVGCGFPETASESSGMHRLFDDERCGHDEHAEVNENHDTIGSVKVSPSDRHIYNRFKIKAMII